MANVDPFKFKALSFEYKFNWIGKIIVVPFILIGLTIAVIGAIIALPFSKRVR